ncbi:glycosyltransferase [Rufibacter hautae]|uniref:Glycosyltransferase n=1 Tax=Rufibacter hautae TaxID=2595005 RepID=A0A5B6TAU2_9BACT|nr:glycosyltransferase [Rufibacter hautae]KAA3437577.1 glycosyltransferase [Rufibacter hautae]
MDSSTVFRPLAYDIAVLIPCYNNRDGLVKSLKSIVYQPNKLFVVVVDDGSQIPVNHEELTKLGDLYLPIHIIRLETNKGITRALNTGLQWMEENLAIKYIARLDCGDLCHEDRFHKQASFLDQNPEVGLLGTWCTFQNPMSGFSYTYTTPTTHEAILSAMHYRNVFIHPTVMFRAELLSLVGQYPSGWSLVEDYALFFKMLHKTKGAILDCFLVTCEINAAGISVSNRKAQLKARQRVVAAFGISTFYKILGRNKLLIQRCLPYKVILYLKGKVRGNKLI